MVDWMDLPAGGEVHSPRLTGDLVRDGEWACPLRGKLARPHLEWEMVGREPNSLPDCQSSLPTVAIRLELHPGGRLGEGLCDL